MDKPRLLQSGAAHPRGVMMRECWKNRAGYDRVLMTVAATFLTVSASSAFAQNVAPRNSAAELAIDAAVPRPEPANVPPPTAADFKLDNPSVDATKADATKAAEQAAPATKPADVATVPISEPTKFEAAKPEAAKQEATKTEEPGKNDAAKNDTAAVAPAQSPAPAAAASSPNREARCCNLMQLVGPARWDIFIKARAKLLRSLAACAR